MSPRTPRRRIAEGIYVDKYSLTGTVKIGSKNNALSREKAFPPDTPIEKIQRWREETRVELHKERPRIVRGSLGADATLYLDRAKKRPASWKSKRSELRAWCELYGTRPRHLITPADIDAAIAIWRADGVALKTIQNRCRTLHHLYVTLADDKKAKTPLDNVDVPRPPKRKPAFVTVSTIKRVERKLRAGDPFVHAFYMVIASTGLRNSQVNRVLQTLTSADVRRRVVLVEGGKGGEPIPLVLNPDQVAALTALLRARVPATPPTSGYVPMDATKYARAVRAAGWPKGVRPYNARHAVGIELAERGVEDADIQAQLGHSDLSMVRRHYTGIRLSKMKRISDTLEGRLGWDVLTSTPASLGQKRSKVRKTAQNSKAKKTA